jgi:hypothetical protein
MPDIKTMQRISLKDNSDITEKVIQDYIYDNPSVLGLGDLNPIMKEKAQPLGGRLDLLLSDDDNTRYGVELQLGSTDPSHIIRTIEYWDTEKKRYPQYDHCAVIIAEDITGRFQNVISLFNGAIPIIAMQVAAYKTGNNEIALIFTKIMDRVNIATDEEDTVVATDRAYWEKRSTPKMLKLMDELFECLGEAKQGYEYKYNKYYVGVAKDGIVKNFVAFAPKKTYIWFRIKSYKNQEVEDKLSEKGVDISYENAWSRYNIKLDSISDFKDNKDLIMRLVDDAKTRLEN